MSQFLQHYHRDAGRRLILLLALQLPAFAGVAAYFGTGIIAALSLGSVILVGPALVGWLRPASKLALCSLGIGTMCMSGLLIHLGRGMIEMHFHVFVMLAVLIVMASPLVIITAAATIAAHHVVFFLWMPSSVFNYDASLGIVIVHAVFVVVETIPAALVARRFQRFIRAQGTMTSTVRDVLAEVTSQVAVMAATSQQQAEGACSQAASLEETSASLNEISSMTARNSTNAEEARIHASEARREADEGAVDTEELNAAMAGIMEASDNIARVVKAIDEIAFQTNILALNAAVEAARAGEAGMGFGVVAEEVRNLAQRSAAASRETSAMIGDSIEKSRRGSEVGGRVATRLQSIAAKSRSVDELIATIANASGEQSDGIRHVTAAIQQIETVTQDTSAAAEESASVAASVKGQIGKLSLALDNVLSEVGQMSGDRSEPDSNKQGENPKVAASTSLREGSAKVRRVDSEVVSTGFA